jgi:hypothetical protein
VWRFISDLLKDPDRIAAGIEELVGRELQAGHDDPQREVGLWEMIAECARLRSAYQDQQAAGVRPWRSWVPGSRIWKRPGRVTEAELRPWRPCW